MVLTTAAQCDLRGIGLELDPLARMLTNAVITRIDPLAVKSALAELLSRASSKLKHRLWLDWIDCDIETKSFVNYWFAPKQAAVLRRLSYFLIVDPIDCDEKTLSLLKIAISRLIISKEPKASLARDTAHSRPHRTITTNSFDILEALPRSVEHCLGVLKDIDVKMEGLACEGDARNMESIAFESIDAIVTSPPYLNAMDYMRGHRLSLVWLGYKLSKLREIRGSSIGAENSLCLTHDHDVFKLSQKVTREYSDGLPEAVHRMITRYFYDLFLQVRESERVLKPGGTATYIIGNSVLRSISIKNSELLKIAASENGFIVASEYEREIPLNKRYLPTNLAGNNNLSRRMRMENIITFQKREIAYELR